MKLYRGTIPDNPDFNPETQGWTPLREPSLLKMQLIAFPLGLLTIFGLYWLQPVHVTDFEVTWLTILFLILLIPVHELLHAFTHPGGGMSGDTIIGVLPKKLVFYAYYKGVRTRENFMFSLVFPFLMLTVLPLIVLNSGLQINWTLAVKKQISLLLLFNALASSGDLVGVIILLFATPRGCALRNRGYKTYWKKL